MLIISLVIVLDVGSVNIDDKFEEYIADQIASLREKYPQLSEYVAHQITRGDFQAIKRSLGTASSVRVAKIQVPGLPVEWGERVEISRYVGTLILG
jgi:hypothetical protein